MTQSSSQSSQAAQRQQFRVYLNLVERVARAEYRRIPSHMVELEELVSIGAMAVQAIIKGKSQAELEKLNTSYMATAIRWAIRNELRTRFKWYTLRQNTQSTEGEDHSVGEAGETTHEGAEDEGNEASPASTIREAVYQTILSIDGIQDSGDGDSPYDFIKDNSASPDEHAEITELGRAIRQAIDSLPAKERTIMEYRFYRNMQVKDIAEMVGLSSSRITRIVKASLNTVRDYLIENDHVDAQGF